MSINWQLALGRNTPTTTSAAQGTINISDPQFLDIGGGTNGEVLTTSGAGVVYWAVPSATGGTDAPSDGNVYGRHNGGWIETVPLAGGTMLGSLILSKDPGVALEAATKQYVDAHAFSDAPNDTNTYGRHAGAWTQVLTLTQANLTYLQLSGGTLTNALILPASAPTQANQAVTKSYVDNHPVTTDGMSITGNGAATALSAGAIDCGTY
jgi:hypothetical protein